MTQRKGSVKATKINDTKSEKYRGYHSISSDYMHYQVNHGQGEYVRDFSCETR